MSLIKYGWAEIDKFGFPGGIVALTPGTKCVELRWADKRVHVETKGEMLTALSKISSEVGGYKYRGPWGVIYSILCEIGVIANLPPSDLKSFRLFDGDKIEALEPEKYKDWLRPQLQQQTHLLLAQEYDLDEEDRKANWVLLNEDGRITVLPRELPFAYRKARDVLAVPGWKWHPIFKNQSVKTGIHHALKTYPEVALQDILDDLI